MLDIKSEQLLTFPEASSMLPKRRNGKRTHVATLYRWSTQGCRGVVLETCQIGATRCTSVEALQRFFDRLTEARTGHTECARRDAGVARRPNPSRMAAELARGGY